MQNAASRALLALVLGLTLGWPAVSGARQSSAAGGPPDLVGVARRIMIAARYCALITMDEAGRPQARTMDAFPPDDRLVVWFGTNRGTRKVEQIRRDPRVTLYYYDPTAQGYVTLFGTARLVDDPEEKRRRWKPAWEAFYPDREKSYLLIAVTPERIEVSSPKDGVDNDPATWLPPSMALPRAPR